MLTILHPKGYTIIETDASNEGDGGILKQKIEHQEKMVVLFRNWVWTTFKLFNYQKKKV